MANQTALILLLLVGCATAAVNLGAFGNLNPTQIICSVIPIQKDLAGNILRRLNDALSQAPLRERFPLTMAFLADPTNGAALIQGGESCARFFTTLQQKFQEDLRNNGLAGNAALNQLTQWINNPSRFLTPGG